MIFRLIDIYTNILNKLMVLMMAVLLFAVGIQILGRYVPFIPRYMWPLELTNFALIWMIFLGSILAVREKRHFYVDLFPHCSPKMAKFFKVVYYLVTYSVCFIFIIFGYEYFIKWGLIQTSDLTGLNLGFIYFSVPFTGISWLIFLTADLYQEIFMPVPSPELPKGGTV